MALIKCPECKKEISNTAKKCPHCGFEMSKKKNNQKISFKKRISSVVNLIKNNKKVTAIIIGIVIIMVLIIFSILYYESYESKRIAEKTVEYLENEGFSCETVSSYEWANEVYEEEVYICNKKNVTSSHEYRIHYGSHISMLGRLDYSYFDVTYTYREFEYSFSITSGNFNESGTNIIFLKENGESVGSYQPANGNDFDDCKVELQDVCYQSDSLGRYTERCNKLQAYDNQVTDSLKMYKELYNAIDVELEE